MALTSVQKGNVIESQIATLLMLISDGELAPYRPLVDDDGIDLIVGARGGLETVFMQIKSRFITNARYKNRLDFSVKQNTLSSSRRMLVLCVYYDQLDGRIDTMWLIPASVVIQNAISVKSGFRIVASRNVTSADKWSQFKVTPTQLVNALQTRLGSGL